MNQSNVPVPREVIDSIVVELERQMDDARAQWSLPHTRIAALREDLRPELTRIQAHVAEIDRRSQG
jgi:hypothetical protein